MHRRTQDFARAILQRIPERATVLEIGCGEGQLTQLLREAGCAVTALDPNPRAPFKVVGLPFETFEAPACSFDCIAAQLVLHHAPDLDGFLDKAQTLLRPDGAIAVDEYGWERAGSEVSEEWRNDRRDLHTSQRMLESLHKRFTQAYYIDHAYFEEGAGSDRLAFTFIGRPRED